MMEYIAQHPGDEVQIIRKKIGANKHIPNTNSTRSKANIFTTSLVHVLQLMHMQLKVLNTFNGNTSANQLFHGNMQGTNKLHSPSKGTPLYCFTAFRASTALSYMTLAVPRERPLLS